MEVNNTLMEILKNKNYKSYDYISRYANVPEYYHSLDKKYLCGTAYQLSKDTSYLIHKVIKNDTLDSLSLTYYNSPLYFWVIMDFNNLQDPFLDLVEGSELRIPTLSAISFEVNK